MKILITGAKGFVGKNLIAELKRLNYSEIYEFDLDSSLTDLDSYSKDCNFVFHLAGANRPANNTEFMSVNYGLVTNLITSLRKHKNKSPILFASSTQAIIENSYGLSKKKGEDELFLYAKESNVKVLIYRFPNVFGKWSKPNYNSVIATFSYNIANDLPITINDPNVLLNLIYIDDLVKELVNALHCKENRKDEFCFVEPVYSYRLGDIVDLLYSFKESRKDCLIPDTSNSFVNKLYATYLSYIPKHCLVYDLKMNTDYRGSFTEFLKTPDRGQVSINISKPGIVKGNHWHQTKNEKFLVVSGKGVIRLRKIDENEHLEYYVSGEKLQVVDIPPGYTHNIENIGESDMVTVIWVNESYDKENPDTITLEV